MTDARPFAVVAMLIVSLALPWVSPSSANAQGRSDEAHGRGGPPPRPGGGTSPSGPGTASPAAVPLATWLDDASTLRGGEAWLGFSFAHWSAEGSHVWFAPSTLVMAGVSDRIGLGASMFVYHASDASGVTTRGIGDVTIFGKLGLVQPETRTVGFALTPVLMVFQGSAQDAGRTVGWALPVSVERRLSRGRVYASAGYFSTGATYFNSAAEVRLASRLAVLGTLGGAFATGDDGSITPRRRTDLGASLMAIAGRNLTLSLSLGRSFSGDAALDGGPWIAAGFAIRPAGR